MYDPFHEQDLLNMTTQEGWFIREAQLKKKKKDTLANPSIHPWKQRQKSYQRETEEVHAGAVLQGMADMMDVEKLCADVRSCPRCLLFHRLTLNKICHIIHQMGRTKD